MTDDMMRLMGEADAAAEASLLAADEALAAFQTWTDRWARRRFPEFAEESPNRRRQAIGKHLAQEVWELSRAYTEAEVQDEAGDVLVLLARYCSEHNVALADVAAGVRAKLTARLRAHEEGRLTAAIGGPEVRS